jgi:hypothetical protein
MLPSLPSPNRLSVPILTSSHSESPVVTGGFGDGTTGEGYGELAVG